MKTSQLNEFKIQTQIFDGGIERQHVNGRIFGSYLKYVTSHYPNFNLQDFCQLMSVEYEDLISETNWYSISFTKKFYEHILQKTDEPNLPLLVGGDAILNGSIGSPLLAFIKYYYSLDESYKNLQKLASFFNKLFDIRILEKRPGFIRYDVRLLKFPLSEEEKNDLVSVRDQIILNLLGYLKLVPLVYKIPPAKVESTFTHETEDYFSYSIECSYFSSKLIQYKRLGIGILVCLLLNFQFYQHFELIYSIACIAIFFCFYQLYENSLLKKAVKEIYSALLQSDIQFKKIEKKSEENTQLRISAELGRIASQVTHDLKSPVAALKMMIPSFSQDSDEKTFILKNAISRIDDVINSMLIEFKKINKNKVELIEKTSQTFNLYQELDNLIKEKKIQYSNRSNLSLLFKDEISDSIRVQENYKNDLSRIISNIIDNSCEAITDGGVVHIELQNTSHGITLEVTDNGKGIPDEILSIIGSKQVSFGKKDGCGIALYNAKKTIESWGGYLDISSTLNVGTRVSFYLPNTEVDVLKQAQHSI